MNIQSYKELLEFAFVNKFFDEDAMQFRILSEQHYQMNGMHGNYGTQEPPQICFTEGFAIRNQNGTWRWTGAGIDLYGYLKYNVARLNLPPIRPQLSQEGLDLAKNLVPVVDGSVLYQPPGLNNEAPVAQVTTQVSPQPTLDVQSIQAAKNKRRANNADLIAKENSVRAQRAAMKNMLSGLDLNKIPMPADSQLND